VLSKFLADVIIRKDCAERNVYFCLQSSYFTKLVNKISGKIVERIEVPFPEEAVIFQFAAAVRLALKPIHLLKV